MGKMVVVALALALVFGAGWFAGAAGLFEDAREAVSKAWSERVASRESEPTILSRGVEPVRDVERVAPAAPSNPTPTATEPAPAAPSNPTPTATEPAPAAPSNPTPTATASLCETTECEVLLQEVTRNLREGCYGERRIEGNYGYRNAPQDRDPYRGLRLTLDDSGQDAHANWISAFKSNFQEKHRDTRIYVFFDNEPEWVFVHKVLGIARDECDRLVVERRAIKNARRAAELDAAVSAWEGQR